METRLWVYRSLTGLVVEELTGSNYASLPVLPARNSGKVRVMSAAILSMSALHTSAMNFVSDFTPILGAQPKNKSYY